MSEATTTPFSSHQRREVERLAPRPGANVPPPFARVGVARHRHGLRRQVLDLQVAPLERFEVVNVGFETQLGRATNLAVDPRLQAEVVQLGPDFFLVPRPVPGPRVRGEPGATVRGRDIWSSPSRRRGARAGGRGPSPGKGRQGSAETVRFSLSRFQPSPRAVQLGASPIGIIRSASPSHPPWPRSGKPDGTWGSRASRPEEVVPRSGGRGSCRSTLFQRNRANTAWLMNRWSGADRSRRYRSSQAIDRSARAAIAEDRLLDGQGHVDGGNRASLSERDRRATRRGPARARVRPARDLPGSPGRACRARRTGGRGEWSRAPRSRGL